MGSAVKVDVGGLLAAGRRRLEVDERVELADFQEFTFPEPAHVLVDVDRAGRGLQVTGSIDVRVVAPCLRCLTDVGCELLVEVDERFEVAVTDDPFADNNVIVGDELDVSDLVRQLVASALPIGLACSENCQGLCSLCGNNKNDGGCGCPSDTEGDHGES